MPARRRDPVPSAGNTQTNGAGLRVARWLFSLGAVSIEGKDDGHVMLLTLEPHWRKVTPLTSTTCARR